MPNAILTRAIEALCRGDHLTADHTSAALDEVMQGRSGEVQTAAFLIALRAKGETVGELIGLARTMRSLAAPVDATRDDLVDTAGTGGGPSTFNISTAAALVAAGAGCAVAKHGNRSNTSRCGSADLLEELGVRIELAPADVARCIDEIGFGFMFAPRHHAAMKHVVPVRRDLGVHTVFNFLGPLTNPAGATRQVLGVSNRHYQETIAEALVGLGCERALVVAGEDGVDELTSAGETRIVEVADGGTEEWFVRPEDVGVERGSLTAIAGGEPDENAATVRRVLDGEPGPALEVVALNAGAAILVGGRADDLAAGVATARETIGSGAAREVLGTGRGPMSRLDELVESARADVERRRERTPAEALRTDLGTRGGARPFNEALVRPGLSLIAEFKRRSPSGGDIAVGADVGEVLTAYERGGAAAISILTDERNFGGSLEDLRAGRAACGLPILRKDFIVDPYQLLEAAVAGADAVLLIAAALPSDYLRALREEAWALDLDCVVEVHDEEDLERALELDADALGINNRDLRDLSVDLEVTAKLITDVPAGKTVVSESGYSTRAELDELERIGVDAVLIGEALMRSGDPEWAVRELTGDEAATREHYLERADLERAPGEGERPE
jgi:anthranilate phosphoribosyltransferase